MSYSNSGGGTLTLPSPTHVHHVDMTSAVRSIRRSLSRSPSKFRLGPKSPSSSPKSPLSPSPLSPPKRHNSMFSSLSNSQSHTPSPLATPYPPSAKSAKLALRSSARAKGTPTRSSSRTRTSPKSPLKRALSQTGDTGNTLPNSISGSVIGQENGGSTSCERKSFERIAKMPYHLDVAPPVNHALSRLGGDGASDTHTPPATSSTLKRSDAIMNLDQASLGSPVAKRRSLHGSASFGEDFNVFNHAPFSTPQFDIHDDSNHEYELSTASITSDPNSPFTSMPRRSSSLRKSTLQQRHGEKTSWGRRHAAQILAQQQAAAAAAAAAASNNHTAEISTPTKERNRPRLSLDQFMPPMSRDSPFSSQGSLPNASIHILNPPTHQPHPLSRTMTTSSSSSSIPDESPTHIPPQFNEQPRPKMTFSKPDFSKSLPAGSLRPFSFEMASGDDESFATPNNYKSAKPLPAAFASTGLISKVNRHPEDPQIPRGTKANVPDTPCKKSFGGYNTYPALIPGSAIARARHVRHSFGTPSTPFNLHGNQPAIGTFGKPSGIFGSAFENKGLTRRGSFLSIDGDENGGSPDAKSDIQLGVDKELLSTPTKQASTQQDHESPSNNRSLSASQSIVGYGFTKRLPRTSSKLMLSTSHEDEGEESDESMDMNNSPTTAHGRVLKSSDNLPSFSRPRTHRNLNLHVPAKTIPKSITAPLSSPSIKPGFAKFSHVAPASPLERIDFMERRSPRTPKDNVVPPDPSGLSISNHRDGNASKYGGLSRSLPQPVTPTTARDYLTKANGSLSSTKPISISTFAPLDVDEALTSRFKSVEIIGCGEFSTVYKATRNPPSKSSQIFDPARVSSTPKEQFPPESNVFAVKKSREQYTGARDRSQKLKEVNVLKALGQHPNVLHFIDSWEANNYLYIQTEFCENGSFDTFIWEECFKGRLDDFRIWKILAELGGGLQFIHNSGYIHLDLKPANIFITFEGALKIGDFGMATSWPAQPGIEGEGDRTYIGPEILEGKYDKPADVFALGLIMLELAANMILPENGVSWQKLRSADFSDVEDLVRSVNSSSQTLASETFTVRTEDSMDLCEDASGLELDSLPMINCKRFWGGSTSSLSHNPGNLFGSSPTRDLQRPPPFMTNPNHEHSLENVVSRMIDPNPQARPTIDQVLEAESVRWVKGRSRAGATIDEGPWGPADETLCDDAEMILPANAEKEGRPSADTEMRED